MKKIFLYATALLLGAGALTSCNDGDDHLTDSRITNYVTLELIGDDFIALPMGTQYVDPGCKATLAGEDASSRLIVDGVEDVDPNTLGFYEINYYAVNDDGFANMVTRTVCVYDPTIELDISGNYETDMNASVYLNTGGTFAYYASALGNTNQVTGIKFDQVVPGIFYTNELFGGWYWQIRGYGSGYAMTAYVAVNDEGELTVLDSYTPMWGDGIDYLEDGVVDLETGAISYSLSYGFGVVGFSVVLNKKN